MTNLHINRSKCISVAKCLPHLVYPGFNIQSQKLKKRGKEKERKRRKANMGGKSGKLDFTKTNAFPRILR